MADEGRDIADAGRLELAGLAGGGSALAGRRGIPVAAGSWKVVSAETFEACADVGRCNAGAVKGRVLAAASPSRIAGVNSSRFIALQNGPLNLPSHKRRLPSLLTFGIAALIRQLPTDVVGRGVDQVLGGRNVAASVSRRL